ncbi:MAG: BolA family protein [Pseudanabaenaceae cyanobacterium]
MENLAQVLQDKLAATYIHIEDESQYHRHHREGGSGHYAVTIVSPLFRGKTLLEKHRLVYGALGAEMGTVIHALAIRAYAPEEWQQENDG